MIIMAFDISSSTIGWSKLELKNDELSLVKYGFIKPPPSKAGSLSARLSETEKIISKLFADEKPDEIIVENYVLGFQSGRSSANTIIVLSVFNELVSLLAYKYLNKDPVKYPVATIRSAVGKFLGKKIVSKDDVYNEILNVAVIYKPPTNKRGNNIAKETYDIVDSIAVGITYVIKENIYVKRYTL